SNRVWSQVCSTVIKPICPPRRVRPKSTSVSPTALKRSLNRIFLLVRIRALSSCGNVNTKWKYPTGNSSDFCLFSHLTLANDWHLGQCRLRQELHVGRPHVQ